MKSPEDKHSPDCWITKDGCCTCRPMTKGEAEIAAELDKVFSAIDKKQDEKIARIVKEFREEFPGTIHSQLTVAGITSNWESSKDIEAWLTQTLTTLLNEE